MAKVEWHQGELFPSVGFVVTNLSLPAVGVTHFYNGRGTAEQWIKEGKYALNWTRLSCHRFVANQVRLWLFVLAYSSGPHHQDSGEAKIRESTAGVSRKPSSDCKARGCSSKHLCGLTAWNT